MFHLLLCVSSISGSRWPFYPYRALLMFWRSRQFICTLDALSLSSLESQIDGSRRLRVKPTGQAFRWKRHSLITKAFRKWIVQIPSALVIYKTQAGGSWLRSHWLVYYWRCYMWTSAHDARSVKEKPLNPGTVSRWMEVAARWQQGPSVYTHNALSVQ